MLIRFMRLLPYEKLFCEKVSYEKCRTEECVTSEHLTRCSLVSRARLTAVSFTCRRLLPESTATNQLPRLRANLRRANGCCTGCACNGSIGSSTKCGAVVARFIQ